MINMKLDKGSPTFLAKEPLGLTQNGLRLFGAILKGQKKNWLNSQGYNPNLLMRHQMMFAITQRCYI